jgi:uncharacterized protein
MGKLTFWLLLAGLLWLGWTLWRVGKRRADAARKEQADPPAASPATKDSRAEAEPMVSCALCKVYLPRGDAVADSERYFCSTAHRDATGRSPGR